MQEKVLQAAGKQASGEHLINCFFLSKLSKADSIQPEVYVHSLISFLKYILG